MLLVMMMMVRANKKKKKKKKKSFIRIEVKHQPNRAPVVSLILEKDAGMATDVSSPMTKNYALFS
jgi:hypothetical protein